MRYAPIIAGLLILLSCENKKSEAELFHALYGNKFVLNDESTIEFVDSSSYVISGSHESSQRRNYGHWGIESDLRGVFLRMRSDSVKLWVVNISESSVKFETSGKIFEYRKVVH
jgi:hypothetical protein